MKRLTVALLLLLTPILASAYDKLTEEEAANWWNSISYEEKIEWIITWDYTEHVEPDIPTPEYWVVVAQNGDVALIPKYEEGVDYDTLTIGDYLSYKVQWPEQVFEKAVHFPSSLTPFLQGMGVGALITVATLVGLLLSGVGG